MLLTCYQAFGNKPFKIQEMSYFSVLKSTAFLLFLVFLGCVPKQKEHTTAPPQKGKGNQNQIVVAANRTEAYLPLLQGKTIGVVANQTSVLFKERVIPIW